MCKVVFPGDRLGELGKYPDGSPIAQFRFSFELFYCAVVLFWVLGLFVARICLGSCVLSHLFFRLHFARLCDISWSLEILRGGVSVCF